MTTITMEQPRAALPFPTTVGFRSTSGFDIAPVVTTTGKGSMLLLSKAPQASLAEAQPQQPQEPQVSPTPSVKVPPTPEAQESTSHVGWRGLLEISQHSGSSGVLGAKAVVDDVTDRGVQLEICCTAHTNPAIRRLVKSVIRGIKALQEPEKALDGMGGTYFFSNEAGKKAAILKPCDEEPLAPNNPKGYVGRALGDPGWKPTVRVGEAAMREVAAYLLDHDNWSRVPTSVLVRARHPIFCYNSLLAASARTGSCLDLRSSSAAATGADMAQDRLDAYASGAVGTSGNMLPMKLGSLQEFVQHECDTSEMGPSRFSVRDVHRIGILDIRIFNTDRHAGNMLVRLPRASAVDLKSHIAGAQYELIPIDHGFCLPETLEAPYFEWLHWPQTLAPFTEDELQYIRDLDIERDKAILRQELPNLRPECLRILEVSTTLLKLCADAGLNLFEVASVMTRPFIESDEEPSELEKICVHAKQCAQFKMEHPDALGESDVDDLDASDSDAPGTALRRVGGHGFGFGAIQEDREQEMLFDLDDDAAGHLAGRLRNSNHSSALAPVSPSVSPSPGSSPSSSSMDQLSLGDSSSAAAGDAMSPFQPTPIGRAIAPAMARSLHVSDAFAWRKMKTQQQTIKQRSKSSKRSPQLYPPPVLSFAPDSLNAFFSDFTEPLWAEFMDELRREIDEALSSGRWRQSSSKDAFNAMSCPRF